MNNYQKCSKRDKAIFDLLESQVCLNTDMIRLLLFKGNCLRIVQRRLTVLSSPPYPRINRDRMRLGEPYFYFMGHRPAQLSHTLGVSWIYTWMAMSLSNMERIHSFDREVKAYKTIRPDAFVCIKNLWKEDKESLSFAFIELDIGKSYNDFSGKVKKYNEVFSSGSYMSMWWVKSSKRFPSIIVVTTGRVKTIKEKIDRENVNNLDFKVYSLDQIKGELLNGSDCSRNIWSR